MYLAFFPKPFCPVKIAQCFNTGKSRHEKRSPLGTIEPSPQSILPPLTGLEFFCIEAQRENAGLFSGDDVYAKHIREASSLFVDQCLLWQSALFAYDAAQLQNLEFWNEDVDRAIAMPDDTGVNAWAIKAP
jgi:hypothetical protein